MNYIIEYELAALVFLIAVGVRYFTLRRFPDILSRFFGAILWIAAADISLDLIGSYTIEHAATLPAWINYVINTTFYIIQLAFPALLMTYVLCMAGKRYVSSPRYVLLLLPAVTYIFLLLFNPIHHLLFYLKSTPDGLVYTRGILFSTMYLGGVFYLIASVLFLCFFRRIVRKRQFYTMLAFIAFNAGAMILQYIFPRILLTGVGISLAVLMMFMTLENPESMVDIISGTFTYNAMQIYLNRTITEKRRMLFIVVDIKGVRRINDTLGIEAGNQLLKQIGSFFVSFNRKAMTFRMINTRFFIAVKNERDFYRILNAIEERFRSPWSFNLIPLSIDAAIRYYNAENIFGNPSETINLIDVAFENKYSEAMSDTREIDAELIQTHRRTFQIEKALQNALETNEGFYLRFQPIYMTENGKCSSAEVLVRLRVPGLGELSPSEFIPIAEKCGLVHKIDCLVISKVCNLIKQNPDAFNHGFSYFELNLSAADFVVDIFDVIRKIITESGVDPRMICFEVTETAATENHELMLDLMNRMIEHGYRFALDDFGTGYANLSQVTMLPFSIVKLDKSLLTASSFKEKHMFASLISMFSAMDIATVTEGIETLEQAREVKRLGGDYIQGFHPAKPISEDEFTAFICESRVFDI